MTEIEEVDATPVLQEIRPAALPVPAVQAAVAATGFVAGAATVAVLRRRQVRKKAKKAGPLSVLASRSFLVDIHLLDR